MDSPFQSDTQLNICEKKHVVQEIFIHIYTVYIIIYP